MARLLVLALLLAGCSSTATHETELVTPDTGGGSGSGGAAAGAGTGGASDAGASSGGSAGTTLAGGSGGSQAGSAGLGGEAGISTAGSGGSSGSAEAGTGGTPSGGQAGDGGTAGSGGTGGTVDPLDPIPADNCPGYFDYFVPEGTCIWIHGRFTTQAPDCSVVNPSTKTCATASTGDSTVRVSGTVDVVNPTDIEVTRFDLESGACPKVCN